MILGDLRYFVLLERFGRRAPGTAWLLKAGAWSLLVPAASFAVANSLFPDNKRVLFLIYEAMFATLAIAIRFVLLPRRHASDDNMRWMQKLTGFEIVQYALWASADVVILSGHDVGFLVRLVPNALYYVAFVPFAYFTSPWRAQRSTA